MIITIYSKDGHEKIFTVKDYFDPRVFYKWEKITQNHSLYLICSFPSTFEFNCIPFGNWTTKIILARIIFQAMISSRTLIRVNGSGRPDVGLNRFHEKLCKPVEDRN